MLSFIKEILNERHFKFVIFIHPLLESDHTFNFLTNKPTFVFIMKFTLSITNQGL